MSEPEDGPHTARGVSVLLRPTRIHQWLCELTDVQLWTALFLGRALLIAPILAVLYFGRLEPVVAPMNLVSQVHSLTLLTYVLLIAPALETLFECSLPHLLLKARVYRSPWRFALISATLMAAIHPLGLVSVFPLLTGLLLAYCYLLFLRRYGAKAAFAATASLHVAINLAGLALTGSLLPLFVNTAA